MHFLDPKRRPCVLTEGRMVDVDDDKRTSCNRNEFHPSFGYPGSRFVFYPKCLDLLKGNTESPPAIPIMVPDTNIYMLFAHRQWRAGMLLADVIYTKCVDLSDKCVLELGAGTGLPSLTAALSSAPQKVVVTDYDDDAIVGALRSNIKFTRDANPNRRMAPIVAAGHSWGHAMDDVLDLLPPNHTHFDVILLADCVWERFSHDILLRSIKNLLSKSQDARIYMVAGLHTGRRVLIQFFRLAIAAGFVLVPLPNQDMWPSCTNEKQSTSLEGSEHVLELEVGGTWNENQSPSLTGGRRPFLLHRGNEAEDDEPIHERNHWLTVSCLAWAR